MTRSEPRYQGDEDSLCGPYSVINALRLLWPDEMDAETTSAAFKAVVNSLDRWPSILYTGTFTFDMATMLKAAQAQLAEKNLRFSWYRPFKARSIDHFEVFETNLRHELDCPGTAAIVCLDVGKWFHWSAVRRFTENQMRLADSGGTNPIRLVTSTLRRAGRKSAKTGKFAFDYPYTFVVRRDA
jgi:hypothetical protein